MTRSLCLLLGVLLTAVSAASISIAGPLTLYDTDGKPVADAVVSFVPVGAVVPVTTGSKVAEMNQRAEAFWPKVLAVQTGTDVAFLNQDPTRHHVYSYSPAKQFERQVPARGDAPHVVFDKSGIVALGCNIHDQMLAYVIVVDTPYFAKTDSEGTANPGMLPNGAYKATIWHARIKAPNNTIQLDVSVDADKISGLDMKLSLKPERRSTPDADRGAY